MVKGGAMIVGKSSIFSREQKREFQKLSIVKDARELVTAEMVHRMFPPTSLNALSDIIDSAASLSPIPTIIAPPFTSMDTRYNSYHNRCTTYQDLYGPGHCCMQPMPGE